MLGLCTQQLTALADKNAITLPAYGCFPSQCVGGSKESSVYYGSYHTKLVHEHFELHAQSVHAQV